jgi:hypothetical protein
MRTMVLAYLVCTATGIFSLSSPFFVSVPELAVISFIVLPTPCNYSVAYCVFRHRLSAELNLFTHCMFLMCINFLSCVMVLCLLHGSFSEPQSIPFCIAINICVLKGCFCFTLVFGRPLLFSSFFSWSWTRFIKNIFVVTQSRPIRLCASDSLRVLVACSLLLWFFDSSHMVTAVVCKCVIYWTGVSVCIEDSRIPGKDRV